MTTGITKTTEVQVHSKQGSEPIRNTVVVAAVTAIVEGVVAGGLDLLTPLTIGVGLLFALPVAIASGVGYWGFRRKRMQAITQTSEPLLIETSRAGVEQHFLDVLGELGIRTAASTLHGSQYTPTECMQRSRKNLSFMGVVGSKWVVEPHVRADFQAFLRRIQGVKGSVRFLLVNPAGEAFKHLRSARDGGISAESLKHFKSLQQEFPCLEVRVYNHLPSFRVVLIDSSLLALSRYRIDKEGYFQSRYGWEAPHLEISSEAPWSLYESFDHYFEHEWQGAQPIDRLKLK